MRNLVLESKSHVFLRAVAPFGTTALIVYNGLVAQDPAGSAIKRITDSDILWREWNMLVDYLVEDNKNVTAKEYMGIFGNPIKHTLSPVIHDTLSEAFGIDAKYVPYQIPVEKLDAAVKEAYTNGMLGLNITVPFKQQVMESLVDIDPAARAIGAVNTLVRGAGGFVGYNTDMPGLARAIASEGLKLQNSKVILLGAGGAARAVAYMCLKYGANKVYIINRTFENAKKLADDMNACFMCEKMIPVSAADYKMIPKDSYFMLQCTSIGLHENDGLPLIDDVSFYEMASAGVDLIYNPAKTPFLCLLKKLGIPCMNGLKMLLYQGIMDGKRSAGYFVRKGVWKSVQEGIR